MPRARQDPDARGSGEHPGLPAGLSPADQSSSSYEAAMKSKPLLTCATAILAGAITIGSAYAQDRISWRIASAFPKSSVLIGSWGHSVTQDVEAITDGQFRMR